MPAHGGPRFYGGRARGLRQVHHTKTLKDCGTGTCGFWWAQAARLKRASGTEAWRRARGKTVACRPIGWMAHRPTQATLRAFFFLEAGGAARRLFFFLRAGFSRYGCWLIFFDPPVVQIAVGNQIKLKLAACRKVAEACRATGAQDAWAGDLLLPTVLYSVLSRAGFERHLMAISTMASFPLGQVPAVYYRSIAACTVM